MVSTIMVQKLILSDDDKLAITRFLQTRLETAFVAERTAQQRMAKSKPGKAVYNRAAGMVAYWVHVQQACEWMIRTVG